MALDNPYLDEYDRLMALGKGTFRFFAEERDELVDVYSWAVSNDEAIYTIALYHPIVEMGAGSGYWAWLLEQAGARIEAYDGFTAQFGYDPRRTWTTVRRGGPEKLDRYGPEWTLLLVWPPGDDPFAMDCLIRCSSRYVIYVGEDLGATADEVFEVALKAEWREVDDVTIPRWRGKNDYLWVYERRHRDLEQSRHNMIEVIS